MYVYRIQCSSCPTVYTEHIGTSLKGAYEGLGSGVMQSAVAEHATHKYKSLSGRRWRL